MSAAGDGLKVAVAGASGRMGQMLVQAVLDADDLRLSGALDIAGSAHLGQDAAAGLGRSCGVRITSDLHQGLSGGHCLIDFTRPEGPLAHLEVFRQIGPVPYTHLTLPPKREVESSGVAGAIHKIKTIEIIGQRSMA